MPIVTPDQMRAIDARLAGQVDVFIERAGSAVARAAVRMLGGTYGRTVNVIVGTGNNGADGRVAARHLADLGVKVRVFPVAALPAALPIADLVIDAAYGTGFHGAWNPPDVGDAQVLAVDIPSGVDGATGAAHPDGVLAADRTITFAALKPGLLFPPGSRLVGELELVDIGIDARPVHGFDLETHLLQRSDVVDWWPRRDASAHKWAAAVRIIAGGPTMAGAASLAAAGALRSGAGMVHVSSPGVDVVDGLPMEVVQRPLPASGWADEALRSLDRFHAVVLGPGLGRKDEIIASARYVAVLAPLPLVIDGDGLFALAWNADGAATLLRQRTAPTVITPHDGEFQLLTGAPPTADRLGCARRLASETGAVVLLKGAATVVAGPDGRVLVVTAGDERLATAGTGDVLSGVIGALLAHQLPAFEAAAVGAWVHGRAALLGSSVGFIASDLPALIPQVLAEL